MEGVKSSQKVQLSSSVYHVFSNMDPVPKYEIYIVSPFRHSMIGL